jgi:glycerol-3-phosphate dehydrogenase (NAD(P)+)
LSKGRSIDDIVSDMKMVAEGVKSVDGILALADRHGVDAPIARMTQAVIAGRIAVTDVAHAFVSRPPKTEFDGLTT